LETQKDSDHRKRIISYKRNAFFTKEFKYDQNNAIFPLFLIFFFNRFMHYPTCYLIYYSTDWFIDPFLPFQSTESALSAFFVGCPSFPS
jgi:hypothetical protein